MAIISPKRFQRSRFHQAEKKRQLIVFRACGEWLALPIQAVVKVVPCGETYGGANRAGTSLTTYQDRELLVLDVGVHVFRRDQKEKEHQRTDPTETLNNSQYLVITKTATPSPTHPIEAPSNLIAFLAEAAPSVRHVPLSAFKPLPAEYAKSVNIQCVSSLVIEPDRAALFLLNPALVIDQPSLRPEESEEAVI